MSIVLIGYRATGKTSVAQQLGQMLSLPVIDTDVQIETQTGKSIVRIFAEDGESVFRDLETQVLRNLSTEQRLILSTGGGMPVRSENQELLKQLGYVVWLRATPETIFERMMTDPLTGERRPQLTSLPPLEEIQCVLQQRTPLYRKTAHCEIDTDLMTIPEIVARISKNNDCLKCKH